MSQPDDRRDLLDKLDPRARGYLVKCTGCRREGYSPALDRATGEESGAHGFIRRVVRLHFKPLPLDAIGRCADCSPPDR